MRSPRTFLLCVGLAWVTFVGAQKQANVWLFGDHAGLDFNTVPPSAVSGGQSYYPLPNQWNEGTAVICDSSGHLLLYSNGAVIWNRSHQPLPNGSGLLGHPSATQAAAIVARPLSDRFYYVFTNGAIENGLTGMRYSVVDLCLDEGKGDVVPGQKDLPLHDATTERLAVVGHANGRDYWIVGHEYESDVFLVYLLTPEGVTDSLQIAIGPVDGIADGTQIAFSPGGSLMATSTYSLFGYMALYDFNTATGAITNARIWLNEYEHMVWGLAFSPDISKLYFTTSNTGSLRQLDLNAGSWQAILASQVTLGTIVPDYWKDLRLGPDNKIYVSKAHHPFLGRIELPNVSGAGCLFTDEAVGLTSNCSFGLPNVVAGYAYRNKAVDCESGHAGIVDPRNLSLSAYPVPTNGPLTIQWGAYVTSALLRVVGADGHVQRTYTVRGGRELTVDLTGLSSGLYEYRLLTADGLAGHGRVVLE